MKLHWEECAELPVGMFRAQAIIFNDCVYVGGGLTEDDYYDYCVFEYNPDMNLWNLLPPAPVKLFGLGVLSAELVLIGGMSNHDSISDRMFAFDKYLQTWKELVCVLSTARFSPTIVQYESTLIMIGGVAGSTTDDDLKNLTSVEYLVPELSEWVVLGHLPKSSNVCSPSTAQEKGMLYILGGYTTQSAISSTRRGHYSCLSTFLSASGVKLNLWKSLPDTPYLQTTALSLGGCLLALGGTEEPYAEPIHREIYTYNVETELWVKVAELPLACCHCTAVVLPEGTVLLLGGWVRPGKMRASRAVFKGVLSVNSEDSSS